jgi:hypothetical protein
MVIFLPQFSCPLEIRASFDPHLDLVGSRNIRWSNRNDDKSTPTAIDTTIHRTGIPKSFVGSGIQISNSAGRPPSDLGLPFPQPF